MKALRVKPLFFFVLIFNFILFGCNQEDQLKKREMALKKKEEEFEKQKAAEKIVEEVKPNNTVTKFALVEIKVDVPDVTYTLADINKENREEAEGDYKRWSDRQMYASEMEKLIDPGPPKTNKPTQPNYIRIYKQTPHYDNLISHVFTIENYSEDSKYRVMDDFQSQVQNILNERDYKANLDYDNYKRTSSIISRNIFVFDSYSAASIARDKKKNGG